MKVKKVLSVLAYETHIVAEPLTEDSSLFNLFAYTGTLGNMPFEKYEAIKNADVAEAAYVEDGCVKFFFDIDKFINKGDAE